jgi:hypothetical protein
VGGERAGIERRGGRVGRGVGRHGRRALGGRWAALGGGRAGAALGGAARGTAGVWAAGVERHGGRVGAAAAVV